MTRVSVLYSQFDRTDAKEAIALFRQAFLCSEGEDEAELIAQLVCDLIEATSEQERVGFCASEAERMIGCVFFSRFFLANETVAYILSPVGVLTRFQGKGIGQGLIRHGLDQLKLQGAELVLTYGDPDFYTRVGFKRITESLVRAPLALSFPHGWLAQSLTTADVSPVSGATQCVAALNHPQYW